MNYRRVESQSQQFTACEVKRNWQRDYNIPSKLLYSSTVIDNIRNMNLDERGLIENKTATQTPSTILNIEMHIKRKHKPAGAINFQAQSSVSWYRAHSCNTTLYCSIGAYAIDFTATDALWPRPLLQPIQVEAYVVASLMDMPRARNHEKKFFSKNNILQLLHITIYK